MPPVTPSPPDPTELLVRAAANGDLEAWAQLDARYRGVLALFLRRRIPPDARGRFDVDDLLQSAFLAAFRELGSYEYRGPGSFQAWMTSILRNRLHSKLRRRGEPRSDQPIRSSAGSLPSPSEILSDAERKARLMEAVADLPEEQRQVLLLRHLDHLTIAQVAAELGIAESTVLRRLARAIEGMNRRLEDERD